jgi:hypothetical protein
VLRPLCIAGVTVRIGKLFDQQCTILEPFVSQQLNLIIGSSDWQTSQMKTGSASAVKTHANDRKGRRS